MVNHLIVDGIGPVILCMPHLCIGFFVTAFFRKDIQKIEISNKENPYF